MRQCHFRQLSHHDLQGFSSLTSLRSLATHGSTRACMPVAQRQVRCSATSSASAKRRADLFSSDKRPIILYDGQCNLCNAGVNAVLNTDDQGVFRLAALQSETGKQLLCHCGRAPDDISSIVLVEEHQCHIKSDAILKIGQGLNLPIAALASLSLPLPKLVRDAAYDQVAKNRYSIFGKTERLRSTDQRFTERFIQ